MKKIAIMAVAALSMVAVLGGCKGRTQENMVPNGETVEINGETDLSGGVVDMPEPANDSVIANSPAEAAATGADSNANN